jgi:heme A synthase
MPWRAQPNKEGILGRIGVPELLLLLFVAFVIYGTLMTIDSIRRPACQYRFGKKLIWISLLILTNPLLTRYAGGLVWLASFFIFPAVAIVYHSLNRWNNRIQKVRSGGAA